MHGCMALLAFTPPSHMPLSQQIRASFAAFFLPFAAFFLPFLGAFVLPFLFSFSFLGWLHMKTSLLLGAIVETPSSLRLTTWWLTRTATSPNCSKAVQASLSVMTLLIKSDGMLSKGSTRPFFSKMMRACMEVRDMGSHLPAVSSMTSLASAPSSHSPDPNENNTRSVKHRVSKSELM